jgi:hypothetical protein
MNDELTSTAPNGPTRIWRDAHTLYRSFRSFRHGCGRYHMTAWTEVRDACRSRRYRRWWLRTCRANSMFRAGWDWVGPPRNWTVQP